jgi:hypothetical protein
MQRIVISLFALAAFPLATFPLAGADTSEELVEKLLDRIVEKEHVFLDSMRMRTPLMETYIQETPEPTEAGARPVKDHYFLGRYRLADTVAYEALIERTGMESAGAAVNGPPLFKIASRLQRRPAAPQNRPLAFLPRGFAQMAVMDLRDFNRLTYGFEYVRREFLGEVRCLVFDVAPVNRQQPGKFVGRIWVEDRDDSIVRFNGTYIPVPTPKGAIPELYFHFDSWRVNTGGSAWVPAQIYVEEEGRSGPGFTAPTPRFKAQSRIWDYAVAPSNKLDELTSILIESATAVKDQDAPKDVSPLESQRSWEHQAEENLLARLEKGGFLAPPGPVDAVLNTVVGNLIVSAKLNLAVHCRVMLTTPIETFFIGHTIVVSRGLIDVLPDEASLALVLASELSHIALGHPAQTQFAFNNQTMLTDLELLQRFRFRRSPEEMLSASKKTIAIMRASPYQNTANAGLFLKALGARSFALPRLLQANLGDQVADPNALRQLAEFAASAPALEEDKLEQIAALPLGSRVKLNPWNNRVELIETRPLSLLSPREKMPFEVTPFVLYLTRAAAATK